MLEPQRVGLAAGPEAEFICEGLRTNATCPPESLGKLTPELLLGQHSHSVLLIPQHSRRKNT